MIGFKVPARPFEAADPGTNESHWLPLLRRLPSWEPTRADVTVVAPHPDDETLGCGGLIAVAAERGLRLTVVSVTDGEAAPVDQKHLADVRHRELRQSLKALGATKACLVRLRLPDGNLSRCVNELIAKVRPHVHPKGYVFAPTPGDGHPDHEAVALACNRLGQRIGVEVIGYPVWAWVHREVAELEPLDAVRFDLPDWAVEAKERAMSAFESQLVAEHGPPIVPPHVLQHFRRPFEVFVR